MPDRRLKRRPPDPAQPTTNPVLSENSIVREEQRLLAAEGKRRPPLRLAGE